VWEVDEDHPRQVCLESVEVIIQDDISYQLKTGGFSNK
jgi:hypothetical protein